jgi:ABC-2 type transport system permease protein
VRLLYTELLKIRTAPRTTLGLVLGLLGLVGLGAGATASDAGGELGDEMLAWDVVEVASTATLFTLILGILIVTWEYRHGTITQTYLATPRRERVIVAKVAVAFAAGAVLAAVSLAVALVVARFWFSFDLERGQWELAGRVVLGAALWGVLGAGVGALLQTQVGAIVTSFVWFVVAEPLITEFVTSINSDYLPGNVFERLIQTPTFGPVGPEHSFGLWAAALISALYAIGFATLGTAAAVRRDVA